MSHSVWRSEGTMGAAGEAHPVEEAQCGHLTRGDHTLGTISL